MHPQCAGAKLLVQMPFSYWHCFFSGFQEHRHISNTHSNLWETFHIHNWAFTSDCSTKWQSYHFLEKNKSALLLTGWMFPFSSENFGHGYKAEGNSSHLSENNTLEVQQVQHLHIHSPALGICFHIRYYKWLNGILNYILLILKHNERLIFCIFLQDRLEIIRRHSFITHVTWHNKYYLLHFPQI